MFNRLILKCSSVFRNASASSKHKLRVPSRTRRTQAPIRNIISPFNYSVISPSISPHGYCTNNKTDNLPTLSEIQSYNTEQLCRWLARYSEETNSTPSNSSTNTDATTANTTNTRVFNDQTLTALRGQLIDGPSLFHYPSARSIQCSGVQHKQAQRLFDLIQRIKTESSK